MCLLYFSCSDNTCKPILWLHVTPLDLYYTFILDYKKGKKCRKQVDIHTSKLKIVRVNYDSETAIQIVAISNKLSFVPMDFTPLQTHEVSVFSVLTGSESK